ncbi:MULTISPECIES: hypothetical protein [Paenibacillus]|uniref:CdiI immunity protein domain-containing protein n=1 Tax=Paenibacillus oleatilyticus TaxID=2594886 RepID=A0ABV4UXX0_9BACL|nr:MULTISPECIES: hypothetical protein [Paenibacillus]KPV56114.1 hypothetical protein QJ48_29335 [Paenibacillus sp. A3]MBU7317287.1 hypothetical protein [Paenibacillus oleatilyticus]
MQKTCQKIVRVQDGLITEIYDGLVYRDFSDNESALKELLMDDIGLDFDSILHTYEQLIYELACSSSELRSSIMKRLPEGWLDWAHDLYSDNNAENKAMLPITQPIL